MRLPRIAVLMDENTSTGGTRYEAAKGYFHAVHAAGGLPFGIPYVAAMADDVADTFDGLLAAGGRYRYPDAWFRAGETSKAPATERLAVERALMDGFLARTKPVFGICAGMQTLGCMHGCRLTADLGATSPAALEHDRQGLVHPVEIASGSQLAVLLGRRTIAVNTFHREALVEIGPGVRASAHAPDGIVEAIEIPSHRFALGVQWHPELMAGETSDALFGAFVSAAGSA